MESQTPQMLEYLAPPMARAWTFARVMKWSSVYPPLTGVFVYGTWVVAAATLGRRRWCTWTIRRGSTG